MFYSILAVLFFINYKKYLNKLTHIKNTAKRMYCKKLIKENHQDSSKTWKITKEIINYEQSSRKSKCSLPLQLMVRVTTPAPNLFLSNYASFC